MGAPYFSNEEWAAKLDGLPVGDSLVFRGFGLASIKREGYVTRCRDGYSVPGVAVEHVAEIIRTFTRRKKITGQMRDAAIEIIKYARDIENVYKD